MIPEQDLVPVNAEREAFIKTRVQEVDLPLRFTVVYQDLERDADIGGGEGLLRGGVGTSFLKHP